jgi:hypothetical protein
VRVKQRIVTIPPFAATTAAAAQAYIAVVPAVALTSATAHSMKALDYVHADAGADTDADVRISPRI